MADVARVAGAALEEPSVEHDAATDSGRDHHGEEVLHPAPRARPCLPEGEGLGVIVDEHGHCAEPRQLFEPRPEREPTPGGDVQWRYGGSARFHRAPCADSANLHRQPLMTSLLEQLIDQSGQNVEQLLAVSDLRGAALVPDNDLRA